MAKPVHPKVKAASATAAVSTLLLFALSQFPWFSGLPGEVQGAILALATAGLTFLGGYLQKGAGE